MVSKLSLETARPLAMPLRDPEREHGFEPLRVEGRLPTDLRGTLYRNGPSVFGRGGVEHWFDAPGGITAVRLEDGAARGAFRVLHTPEVDAAIAAGRSRHLRFRHGASLWNRLRILAGGTGEAIANINVTSWQGRLLALIEASPALEVDPETLDVVGPTDFDGRVPTLQAHAHRVPALRTTFYAGLRIGRECAVDLYAFPDEGGPRRVASVPVPGLGEVHDFFATERHLVLVLAPLWGNPLGILTTGSFERSLRWRPEQGSEVVVIPLDAPERLVRFHTDPFFWWHGTNAWDEGDGTIGLEMVRYPDFGTVEQLDELRRGGAETPSAAALWRARIDPRAERFDTERVLDESVEFPWVHDALQGRRHRYSWMGAHAPEVGRRGWWNRLVRRDAETGDVLWVDPGPGRAVGEPVLVPRSDAELDAWVLALVRDTGAGATHLGIWDAARPEDGPVARVWFDQMLPHALHGTWVPAPG